MSVAGVVKPARWSGAGALFAPTCSVQIGPVTPNLPSRSWHMHMRQEFKICTECGHSRDRLGIRPSSIPLLPVGALATTGLCLTHARGIDPLRYPVPCSVRQMPCHVGPGDLGGVARAVVPAGARGLRDEEPGTVRGDLETWPNRRELIPKCQRCGNPG
jgi:hypothetical protein